MENKTLLLCAFMKSKVLKQWLESLLIPSRFFPMADTSVEQKSRKTDRMIFTYWQAGKHGTFPIQLFGLSVRRYNLLWLVNHCWSRPEFICILVLLSDPPVMSGKNTILIKNLNFQAHFTVNTWQEILTSYIISLSSMGSAVFLITFEAKSHSFTPEKCDFTEQWIHEWPICCTHQEFPIWRKRQVCENKKTSCV